MIVASAPSAPAHFAGLLAVNPIKLSAVKTKSSAVNGAIRPVGTAPNISGFRTNQASIPKCKPPAISTSFVQAMISTTEEKARDIQRIVGRSDYRISPVPRSEKQSAVLGAIGMYLARTLAKTGRPEI